ncbi:MULTISPECIES: hypothetical protein [Pseudomonas]|uniref:hypothetical protein n=1 Tax=Pseudomonas TaxID=286 RepID=UPI00257D1AA1|nr:MULTISPECIES: hypothetical protein [Pseudomonas]
MPTTRLKEMQQDIDDATLQLEAILQMLRSHAIFLKNQKLDHLRFDILLIENQIEALVLSIRDIKGSAIRTTSADQKPLLLKS